MIAGAPVLFVSLFFLAYLIFQHSPIPSAYRELLEMSISLMPLSQLVAGIVGVSNWKRSDRAYFCFVSGLLVLAFILLFLGACILGDIRNMGLPFALAGLSAIVPLIYTATAYEFFETGRKIWPAISIALLVSVALLAASAMDQQTRDARMEQEREARAEARTQRDAKLDALLAYPPLHLSENEIVISDIRGQIIAAGGTAIYVILPDGSLWSMRSNEHWLFSPSWIMDDVAAVAASVGHVMAIQTDGSLWGWGQNRRGQLGDGTTEDRPIPVHIMDDVVSVSATGFATMAIRADGSLWAWGPNYRTLPVRILDDVVYVCGTGFFTMAIRTDGNLWAWGLNSHGQLGDGTRENRLDPVLVLEDVTAVSTGDTYTMALRADGSLWVWGYNRAGRLGVPGHERVRPTMVMDEVIAISAGEWNSRAIRADGSLWAWGYNRRGQLGDGTTESRPEPVMILEDVIAVSSSARHTLAIRTDGSLWVWGRNFRGQFADGRTENLYSPIKIIDSVMLPQ